jgi:hypothetical protein
MANRRDLFVDAFEGELTITLAGNYLDGGMLAMELKGFPGEAVELPRKQYAALAILAQFAQLAQPVSVASYLKADKLAEALHQHQVLELADQQTVIQLVRRIRHRLNRSMTAAQLVKSGRLTDSSEFGYAVVRRSKVLGYQIGLAPENVRLRAA